MQSCLESSLRPGCRASFLLGLCAIALLPAVLAGAQEAQPDNAPERRTAQRRLTVTGQGEVRVRPDMAVITIGVVTGDKTSQAAARANAEAAQKVQNAVRAAGVAEKDIQTVNYSIDPVYVSGGFGGGLGGGGEGGAQNAQPGAQDQPKPVNPQPTISGYRVRNQVRVTVHDLSRLSEIIDAAANAGSNTIEGIGFLKENTTEAEDAALGKAVAEARRKADRLAQAAGVDIVGIYEINEGGGIRPLPYMMARAGAEAASTPISPGEIVITANVTVTYQIGPQRRGAARDNSSQRATARRTSQKLQTSRR